MAYVPLAYYHGYSCSYMILQCTYVHSLIVLVYRFVSTPSLFWFYVDSPEG